MKKKRKYIYLEKCLIIRILQIYIFSFYDFLFFISLSEAVEAVNSVIKSDNNDWVRDYIYGIEKDYRLARVAKISMFMNGAGESNIIFGDGLENSPEKKIINGSFDILVTNPPYSVSAFKSHLKLKNNTLTLLDRISNDGGDIETLFVERIAQLLKPQG